MRKFVLLLVVTFGLTNNIFAQRITINIAGDGTAAYKGDGGPANYAQLMSPTDVCVDAQQNIYFVDQGNNFRIRKISGQSGIITTIAGSGISSSDDVPATNANLNGIEYISTDSAGNIYIPLGGKLRKIDAASGLINTIAGTGVPGHSGDSSAALLANINATSVGIDGVGNIYILESAQGYIRKITAATGIITTIGGTGVAGYSGDGGQATLARFSNPKVLCVNTAGDVFFSDQNRSQIRKIDAGTGIITTVGSGDDISGICSGGADAIYFDEDSCACKKLTLSTGVITVVANNIISDGYNGDGVNSLLVEFNYPHGLFADAHNDIYIADNRNNRIRKVIDLTHSPSYAYGQTQLIDACSGYALPMGPKLAITDLDSAQNETWTVITLPESGTLTGFPITKLSLWDSSLTIPNGTFYTPPASFIGMDSFQVRVSDGITSDTVKILVSVNLPPSAGSVLGDSSVCSGSTTWLAGTVPGGLWSIVNTTVAIISSTGMVTANGSVSTATLDTVIYSIVTSGCTVTTSTTLSINTLPHPGTITGADSLCVGASILLTDTTFGGTWSIFSGPVIIGSSTGILTSISPGSALIEYYLTNVCGSNAALKTVIVNSFPNSGSIIGEASICSGATVTFADPISGGAWSAINGNATVSDSGVVTGVSAGTDNIQYVVSNSCGSDTATQSVVIDDCGIAGVQIIAAPVIHVFPNPSSSTINIEWTALQSKNADVVITDVTGRVVLRTALVNNINNSGTMQINVSGLNDGIYLLSVSSESTHYMDKLVVNKR